MVRFRVVLVLTLAVAAALPGLAFAQISTAKTVTIPGATSHNNVAFDPVHKVYLIIPARPPVTGRFLDEQGVQIGSDFVIALEPGNPYTAWASIAIGGPPSDPVFLVTYTIADLDQNPKYGRLVRYVPGGPPAVSAASKIANATSEWVHSEKAQNVWSGQRFIVGTRVVNPGATQPTFQVNSFGLNGVVSAPVDLGDGADYYGSPALACSGNGVCLAVGFMAGVSTGYSGGSYARRFDAATLAPLGNLFFLASGNPNENQAAVFQAHKNRFLTSWTRGSGGGYIDTRLVNLDGSMSALDLSKGFSGPGAGNSIIAYNAGTQTTLLASKNGPAASLFALELGDDGYPVNPANALLVTAWDGSVLDYETSLAANPGAGQWLVAAQLTGVSVGALIQGPITPIPVQNADFSAGMTGWTAFAGPAGNVAIQAGTSSGVLEFFRTTSVSDPANSSVVFQNTHAAVPEARMVRLEFDAANSSSARKRLAVLVHDADFSDFGFCSFWMAPGSQLRRYVVRVHTSKPWTNASVSLYPASEGSDGGAYRVDNVAMYIDSAAATDRTECFDPAAPEPSPVADGPELLANGSFAGGFSNWTLFGQITGQVTSEVAELIRQAQFPAGVMLQPTGQAVPANTALTATFDLGNSSGVRKRATVIVHDLDFSDLQACTFWLDPGKPLTSYTFRTFTTKAWTNATLSVYVATVDSLGWVRVDNVSFKRTPAATIMGSECFATAQAGSAAPLTAGANMPVKTAASNVRPWIGAIPATSVRSATSPVVVARGQRQASTFTVPATATGSIVQIELGARGSSVQIQVSLDGVEWTTVAEVPQGDDPMTIAIDLSDYAGRKVFVRVRTREG